MVRAALVSTFIAAVLVAANIAGCGKAKTPRGDTARGDAGAPSKPHDAGAGGATAAAMVDAMPVVVGPVAAPAPTFCDGKPCPCKAGTSLTDEWNQCELEASLVVQGVPCSAGRLSFHADGRLSECSLEAPVRVGPYACKVGVGIMRLHPDGRLKRCFVTGAYKVGGYDVEDKHWGSFDFETWPDGTLKEGVLAAPQQIGGKACRDAVTLYANGKPYSCKLDAPLTEAGVTLPVDTPTLFARDGALIGYFPQDDMPFDGGVHQAGYPVCLVKDCNSMPE